MRAPRIALVVLLTAAAAAQARVVEEQLDVPVRVTDGYGRIIEQPINVTVFHDDARTGPSPVLVLNHGRAPDARDRQALGRARYSDVSRWFVARGFIVAVPTRIGYGVSGGPDAEDTGSGCSNRNYPPGYRAAADQTLAVLAAMRQRPDAAPDRAVIVGQSFGGATSITVAALQPAGVQGTINFAGGGGGNPKTHPGQPCSPAALERMFGDYGRTARLPTLWVYTENDQFMGPKHPKEWFDAFVAAGGRGEFVQYPPHGEDGHGLFTRFPSTWQPRVAQFLDSLGYPAKAP